MLHRAIGRRVKSLLVAISLIASICLVAQADKLSPERLLERATRHWPPEFREANSKALVAAYIILGRPLDELRIEARRAIEQWGHYELWNALTAGYQGDYIDICYHPPEVPDIKIKGKPLKDLSDEELLEIATREGYTSEEKGAAATLLVSRAIEGVGVEIGSWYAFRVFYEHTKFDPLKLKLQGWMWYSGVAPELAAATVIPLAQMYLAEHFVWWEWERGGRGRYHGIIQKQLECPQGDG